MPTPTTIAAPKRRVFNADSRYALTFAGKPASEITDAKAFAAKLAAGELPTLTGYAMTWNTLSDDRGGYKVRLAPKSAEFLPTTFALWHHDYAKPIGCTDNATLRITTDDVGAKVEIDLPDTQAGRDAAFLVWRRDVRGMSFGMINMTDYAESKENGQIVITVSKYQVDEVTVTPIPAFTDTSIEVKGDKGSGDYASQLAADAVRLQRFKLARYTLP